MEIIQLLDGTKSIVPNGDAKIFYAHSCSLYRSSAEIRFFWTRAETPAAIDRGGMSFRTTDPAAITEP